MKAQYATIYADTQQYFSRSVRVASFSPSIAALNGLLLVFSLLLLAYYVVTANGITSGTYSVRLIHERLTSIGEENSTLLMQRLAIDDPLVLTGTAQRHGLVPARDISYLFENGNVALNKTR